MWLLALMILIMPFEASPYLYIAPNFLGVFPDFTVIKLLGLVGFAWAMMRLASGHPHGALLGSRPASLFLLFFFGVLFAGLVSGSGFLAISRYLAFLTFLPFVLVSVQTQQDLGRVLLVLELFLTSSRGGFLGLLVAGVVFLYRRRGLAGAVGVMVIMLLGLIIVPTDLGSRLWTVFETETAAPAGLEASNKAHTALFFAALRMIADNPIFGVGPLNFKSLSTLYTGLEQGNIAHNSFLEVAAEFGIPVFVVFVMLIFATFRILNRAERLGASPDGRQLAGWAEGLRSGLIGFLVAGFFISAQYEKMLWLAVFVTIVLGRFAAEVRAAELAAPAGDDGLVLEPVPEPSR